MAVTIPVVSNRQQYSVLGSVTLILCVIMTTKDFLGTITNSEAGVRMQRWEGAVKGHGKEQELGHSTHIVYHRRRGNSQRTSTREMK